MLSDSKWFELICKSQDTEIMFNEFKLPEFPSVELQTRTTGSSGERTLKEAFEFYQFCISSFDTIGNPLSKKSFLLDFGVGWGRISRFFLREVPRSNIFGLDAQRNLISVCKNLFKSENFFECSPFPPTLFKDSQFTHAVGYSVFSHLSEKACRSWMEEFYRILKPNSTLILTTRSSSFLKYCERLKEQQSLSGYSKALSILFDDFDAAKAGYERGMFLHSNMNGVSGSGELNANFYGETFIPEAYAREAYSDLFKLIKFSVSSTYPIAIMVFSKH